MQKEVILRLITLPRMTCDSKYLGKLLGIGAEAPYLKRCSWYSSVRLIVNVLGIFVVEETLSRVNCEDLLRPQIAEVYFDLFERFNVDLLLAIKRIQQQPST